MTRRASLILLLASMVTGAGPHLAGAQEPALNDKQRAGQALFTQHCVVCHMRTQLTSPGQYGPPLSKATLGGDESLIREYITAGKPRMPGVIYNFWLEQHAALAA